MHGDFDQCWRDICDLLPVNLIALKSVYSQITRGSHDVDLDANLCNTIFHRKLELTCCFSISLCSDHQKGKKVSKIACQHRGPQSCDDRFRSGDVDEADFKNCRETSRREFLACEMRTIAERGGGITGRTARQLWPVCPGEHRNTIS